MRVAVCCPGPSLPRVWKGRGGYDAVWSVNRALLIVDTDWLSAGDLPMFNGLAGDIRPRIGAITFRDTANETKWRDTWSHLQFDTWEDCQLIQAHKVLRPINWSVQAAMLHAAERGAVRIDLYGCDGAAGGTPIDCTGYAGEDRGPERWRREEDDLATTTGLLATRGVTVNRIPP